MTVREQGPDREAEPNEGKEPLSNPLRRVQPMQDIPHFNSNLTEYVDDLDVPQTNI